MAYQHASGQLQKGKVWLLLAAIVLLGAGLRLFRIEEKSLWQDEVFTVALATGNTVYEATMTDGGGSGDASDTVSESFDPSEPQLPQYYREKVTRLRDGSEFLHGLSRNIQAPLYPLLMRLWTKTIGPDPVAMRYFSTLAGILCIPVAFFLGRRVRGTGLGLLLAALVALSGFQVTYAQVSRSYTFLTLLTLLSTWLLLKIIPRPEENSTKGVWPWLGFGLVTVLGLYTQYLYHFVLLFQTLYALIQGRGDRKFLLKMAGTALAVGLCYLPWLPVMREQAAFLADVGSGKAEGLWNPVNLPERLWNILTDFISPKSLPNKIAASVVIALGLFQAFREKRDKPLWGFAGVWLFSFIVALVVIDLAGDTRMILTKRYLMLAAPALYLMLALGLLSLPRRLRAAVTSLFLGLMLWNCVEVVSGPKFLRKEDYRSAGQLIATAQRPGDLVLVNHSGVHATGMAFYLPSQTQMRGLSRRTPNNSWKPEELAGTLETLTQSRPRVWMVFTHSPPTLKRQILRWFETGFEASERKKFPGVEVLLYRRKSKH